MSENYIRHQVLPIDDEVRNKVKDLVNEYAASSQGHPFQNYGNNIVLQKYEYAPIYVVNLHSQFDTRTVSLKDYPYKGGSFDARHLYRPSDVNVWAYHLLTTEKYVHNGKSFEVPGSHHVETCGKCEGSGRMVCPKCGGSGTQQCSSCGGNGQIEKTRSEYRHTADKVYSDGRREPVYSYVNVKYYVTCSNCGGSGSVSCSRCGGSTRITCDICQGYGRNVHCFAIDQDLDDSLLSHYFYHPDVAKVQELVDGKKDYKTVNMFHQHDKSIPSGIFTEDTELGDKLDSLLGQHAGKKGVSCHILFQDAYIQRVDVWWVQYTYKGRTYNGCISSKDGEDYFFAGVSPITELADKLLKQAKKKVGGLGTVKAQKLLDQVQKLNVYGRNTQQFGIQAKVNNHLNMLYNMGNDLMFWIIALVGTPFLFNFYSELNPVLRYAHFVNDPNWAPYNYLPVVQCIIYLILLWIAKSMFNVSDHSKSRHLTVFGYVISGMGLYLLVAVVLLAVLLGLNYVGLSIFTSGIFWLVAKALIVALIILIYVILIAYAILKWIWGLIVKLWYLIF